MKKLLTLCTLLLTVAFSYGQSSVSATYGGPDILTNHGSYSATCNAGDTLVVAVPAGDLIVGVDVSYTMTTSSGGWMSEQRSRMECLTTGNTEASFASGSGGGGTYSYNRTNLDLANGISNGSLTFRMQAYRTWGGSGCNATYQVVDSGSWTVTVYYCPATLPFSPIISADTVMGACGQSAVAVAANSNYAAYEWSNGDTTATASIEAGGTYTVNAIDSGGCPYADTVLVSVIAPNVFPEDTSICVGETVELDAQYVSNECVTMNTFTEDNVTVVDHNSLSGDDNGGIAVTPDYFYYTGDSYTVRYNADDMTGGVSLPQREGIFSDLSTGQLYTFWDTIGNEFNANWPSYSYDNINAVRMMDASLNYDSTIVLSQTIDAGSSSFIAAGSGFVILWANSNDTFYHIDLSTGTVTNLGTGNLQTTGSTGIYMYGSENWAEWGIAECWNGGYSVVGRASYVFGTYQYSPGQIVRYDIANGTAEQVTEFSGNISDMACITYSPWHERWYFHHEYSSSVFGGGSETAGFADASTGTPTPVVYVWNTGDTARKLEVTPDSTTMYIVEATDGLQSCYDTSVVTVTPSPEISFSVTNIACKGDSNGAAAASVGSGTAPFTYNWWPADTNIMLSSTSGTGINDVPAGTFYLFVEDDNGCMDMDTVEVEEPLSLFSPILNGEMDPLCSYSEDGRSIVLAAGGDAPYSFNWSNGVTNDTNSTLGDGPYSVTITDGNGCERQLSGDLESPSPVIISLSATGNTCEDDNDGTATAGASGGTAPYAYEWDNGDDDENANSLTSGFHSVTVTDNNGCMFVDSVEVTFENAAPNIALPDSVEKCAENTITLDAGDEGATYLWTTGDTSQTITTNAGGLVFVTVTGANGCEASKSIFITNNPCPTGVSTIDDASIKVYPNPSNGLVNVEIAGNLNQSIDLEVTDMTGRIMTLQAGALGAGSNLTTLNLNHLSRGNYMLRMTRDGELISVKHIVIQ